jgi:Domain of unknown function (DUF4365)
VRALFEDANMPFQEVELGNDIGKDAYVDISDRGRFAGAMIALQIKGGISYRRGDDYKVPCDADDRAVWRGSSVPPGSSPPSSTASRSATQTRVRSCSCAHRCAGSPTWTCRGPRSRFSR